jgi:hypothetical protein
MADQAAAELIRRRIMAAQELLGKGITVAAAAPPLELPAAVVVLMQPVLLFLRMDLAAQAAQEKRLQFLVERMRVAAAAVATVLPKAA